MKTMVKYAGCASSFSDEPPKFIVIIYMKTTNGVEICHGTPLMGFLKKETAKAYCEARKNSQGCRNLIIVRYRIVEADNVKTNTNYEQ